MNNHNTEILNPNWCMINLQEIIANHASKLLWGNGYNFTSEYPEYKRAIEKLKEWNNLDSLFYQDCHIKSGYGYSIVQIDKSKTGRISLNFAQPYAQSRVARVLDTEQGASTWSRLQYDDQSIYVKTTYTPNQIIRYFTSDFITLDGLQEKISKDLQLPLIENHNLGIIPVKFMQNLPKKNFFGGVIGDYYPDMTPIKRLQQLLNKTFESIEHELEYNVTRVFLDITEQEINQSKTAFDLKKLIGKFILQANLRSLGSTSGTPPIAILQGSPILDKYAEFIQFIIDKAFEGSGYSPVNDTTSQKTEAEVLITNSRDMETTRIKRTLNQSDWNEIFQRCFILMGLDGDKSKWTFEIKENTITDRLKSLEIDEAELRLGITNIKRIIVKRYGVSEEEAQQIIEENRKYQKEEIEFNNTFLGETKNDTENKSSIN
ncbi:hypothetical protein [Spiroplasma endosymbiont of Danaus chrysippus]|uniref:hypothetical protein n=1 Tax=Spiroplasma endosymbiont of Danaus chrysippus TaxID=2691041 RepID=UPI0013CB10F3|nr:hypothetical protein [Spiroplasma endosymbiont of Danaus chrysippus]CAB1054771.1 hypothetical protein [Spiroplasma endosymbiont of Danaus chrysippus]